MFCFAYEVIGIMMYFLGFYFLIWYMGEAFTYTIKVGDISGMISL